MILSETRPGERKMSDIPMVIGFCGAKYAGKDAASTPFIEQGFTKINFADVLRTSVAKISGIPVEEFLDSALKEEPDPVSGVVRRKWLTSIGSACRALDEDVFVRAWERSVKSYKRIVVTDIRFENELLALKKVCPNARVYKIQRPGAVELEPSVDATERWWKNADVDYIIDNTGTLDDLHETVIRKFIKNV